MSLSLSPYLADPPTHLPLPPPPLLLSLFPSSSPLLLLPLLPFLLLLLLLFLGTTMLLPDVCICTSRVGRVIRHVFVWAIDPINVAAATLPCRVHNSLGMAPLYKILRGRDGDATNVHLSVSLVPMSVSAILVPFKLVYLCLYYKRYFTAS